MVKNNAMAKKLFFYSKLFWMFLLFSWNMSCVTVSPDLVLSEQMVLSGLQAARRNQIRLIEAYAEDQKHYVEALLKANVMDKVIEKQMKGREALPPDEVKVLLLEYSQDWKSEQNKIEKRKTELLGITNRGFDELEGLTKTNILYSTSLVKQENLEKKAKEAFHLKWKELEEELIQQNKR